MVTRWKRVVAIRCDFMRVQFAKIFIHWLINNCIIYTETMNESQSKSVFFQFSSFCLFGDRRQLILIHFLFLSLSPSTTSHSHKKQVSSSSDYSVEFWSPSTRSRTRWNEWDTIFFLILRLHRGPAWVCDFSEISRRFWDAGNLMGWHFFLFFFSLKMSEIYLLCRVSKFTLKKPTASKQGSCRDDEFRVSIKRVRADKMNERVVLLSKDYMTHTIDEWDDMSMRKFDIVRESSHTLPVAHIN